MLILFVLLKTTALHDGNIQDLFIEYFNISVNIVSEICWLHEVFPTEDKLKAGIWVDKTIISKLISKLSFTNSFFIELDYCSKKPIHIFQLVMPQWFIIFSIYQGSPTFWSL